ncbi:hypothetical protein GCM10010483_29500 [Actinokineospora diospyrosa]
MRWTCFARGPYDTRGRTAKQGPKSMALLRTTLRLPLPHTKQVHPIEHLAPASPTVQALSRWAGADLTGGGLAPQGPSVQVLGWQGRRERAGLAPAVPSVQGLSRWVGVDLTGAGLAPQGAEGAGGWGGGLAGGCPQRVLVSTGRGR